MINGSLDEILQISLLLICDYNLKAYETIHLFLLSLKNYVHKRYAYLEYPNILLIESSLLDFLRLYMGYVHTNDDFAYKKWISKGVATLEISKQILVKMDESILESNIILLLVTSRFIFEIISFPLTDYVPFGRIIYQRLFQLTNYYYIREKNNKKCLHYPLCGHKGKVVLRPSSRAKELTSECARCLGAVLLSTDYQVPAGRLTLRMWMAKNTSRRGAKPHIKAWRHGY